MTPQAALNTLLAGRDLAYDDMTTLMHAIMGGEVPPSLMGALLIALRLKGETVEEIAAAAGVMRELSARVHVADTTHLVDTCGTGGDGAHTFNISTAAMFVAAAAGARVAKHGGRSVSSQSGSADVLEALGVNLALSPDQVAGCIAATGLGFMFAPNHHSAMKHAAPVRRELGTRTLFNILGPLTNPAGAPHQVLGVFRRELVVPMAEVLGRLGSQHALVVHGSDGLDELTIAEESQVAELRNGEVSTWQVSPEEVGLERHELASLKVAGVDEAKTMLQAALAGEHPAARDIVALNAGASLYVCGRASSLRDGVSQALAVIADGRARQKLQALVDWTQAQA